MGKYKNIIFLVETPILERYVDRYGINILKDMGFHTTIFDLSPAILPVAFHNIKRGLCDYEAKGFYRCYSLAQYQEELNIFAPKETLIICAMGYRQEYRKVFRYITKKKYHFCYFMQELAATYGTKANKGIQELGLKDIWKKVLNHIPWQLQGIKGADFILGCGAKPDAVRVFKRSRLCKDECPVIFFHSSNYEDCLLNKDKKRLIQEKYCVFMDQYIPYHPDFIDAGIQIEPKQYYSKMNELFEFIEHNFQIKVIVAAHPRANYETHPESYPNNPIYYDQTCRLIKDSEFAICHYSNSVNYVAAFKKPLLVVADQSILVYFKEHILASCKSMGCQYLDLESYSKEDIECLLCVDEQAYDNYIRDYMKGNYNGSLEGDTLWKQIGEYIETLI